MRKTFACIDLIRSLARAAAAPTPDSPARVEPLEPRMLLSGTGFDAGALGGEAFTERRALELLGQTEIHANSLDDLAELAAAASAVTPAAGQDAGLVPVGQQPQGALSGKIVFVNAGHGWIFTNGAWRLERPVLNGMVEDFGNIDQMNFYVDFLWNAGATVVPLRPVHHQLNEVVLDNDDPEVTFTGAWTDSVSTRFFGDAGDVPYRFASSSATQTASAIYRPDLPEAGMYPVYAWTRAGSDRVSDQLYRVHHSGGITEVTVNHRMVGNGWVYLGNFHFEEGTAGAVEISNRSSDPGGGVVIADAIRFGNGMGDVDRGGGVSGEPREDEADTNWIQAQLGQGISGAAFTSGVSGGPRWAAQMNREAEGVDTDRMLLSFHSNAGGGRGAVGLFNTTSLTPNQFALAELMGREVNLDMQAIGQPTLEHLWSNRTTHSFTRINFGEINPSNLNGEMDATILETAFHDNALDAQLMLDPDVRELIGRSAYQATVKYFAQFGDLPGVDLLPDRATDVAAHADDAGNVTVTWQPPVVDGIGGDAPTGYRIYTSLNGKGFDGGTFVAGGDTTSFTFDGLDPADGVHFFKVVAVNAGGESLDSAVVAARPMATPPEQRVLIVNGFDRVDRFQVPLELLPGGVVGRVRPEQVNSFDYSIQVAEALETYSTVVGIDTVQNEAIITGAVDLTAYDTVVWVLGEESETSATFDADEQAAVSAFVAGGGNLFVSGAEIGRDLAQFGSGADADFLSQTLGATFVTDDANTRSVSGFNGSIFEGIDLTFDDGSTFFNVNRPDVINPGLNAQLAMLYSTGGGAAVQVEGVGGAGRVVMLAFPFETILGDATRAEVMARALDFFQAPPSDAPPAPEGFTAEAGNGFARLDWLPSDDPDIVGFRVYRATSGAGPFVALNTTPQAATVFFDTDAVNGQTRFYSVTAVRADGTESFFAAPIAVTPRGSFEVLGDNDDGPAVFTDSGQWFTGSFAGFDGGTYRFANTGSAAEAVWTIDLPEPGAFEVQVVHLAGTNRATSAKFDIVTADGVQSVFVDQTQNSLQFVSLGTFTFDGDQAIIRLDAQNSTGGSVVIADAVRLVGALPADDTAPQVQEVVLGSSQWSEAVRQAIDPGRGLGLSVPTGPAQLDSIALPGLDQVSVVFTEDVVPDISDMLLGRFPLDPLTPVGFSYDPATFTATWTFAPGASGGPAELTGALTAVVFDRLTDASGNRLDGEWVSGVSEQSGNGDAGGPLLFSMNLLPGDLSGDGFVGAGDLDILLGAWNTSPGPLTGGDLTGDGFVGAGDLDVLLGRWNTGTPPTVDAVPAAGFVGPVAPAPLAEPAAEPVAIVESADPAEPRVTVAPPAVPDDALAAAIWADQLDPGYHLPRPRAAASGGDAGPTLGAQRLAALATEPGESRVSDPSAG